MLAYRSATRRAAPSTLLDDIATLSAAVAQPDANEDAWMELLIACGELEAAATDAVSPERDEVTPFTHALSNLTGSAASGAVATWDGRDPGAARAEVVRALEAVRDAMAHALLPDKLEIGVAEGFAYYGLYPQTYAAAARTLLAEYDAQRLVCVGIRSIGSTLAAVVAAVARDAGRGVAVYTVRPRGHPFDRTLTLAPALEDALAIAAGRGALFAVVDEGPGLSGSSFASVADALSALGVPDERIVFFPSWIPAAESLRSPRGQSPWARHRKLVTSFEELFERAGEPRRIGEQLGVSASRVDNVSGGEWRRTLYADERDWPAVQPQHERRKYLLRDASDAPVALLKFAGLGRHGRAAERRARSLAESGLAPRVVGFHRGFVASEWVPGAPAYEGEAEPELLAAIARHVAHLATTARTSERVPFDELLDVVRVNTAESLGEDVARPLVATLERFRQIVRNVHTCAVDGRMFPHEWIRAASGWVKIDGADHHDDHFLPGDQDPAWDIAGAIVELLLDPRQARALVDTYARRSGDADVAQRLPFHHAVYLATRLGYVTLTAEALGDSPDAGRLRALVRRYTAMLRRAAVAIGAIAPMPLPARWQGVRAIAFDADDTLRRTTVAGQPCPHGPDEWELLPWARDGALSRLPWGDALALGAASNQDHVGYGHLSERQARALLRSMLVEATGHATAREAIRLCPHVLEIPCACRKPADGMLRALLARFDVAPDALLFVGNAPSDAEAARRAGVRFAHVDEFAESLAAMQRDAAPMRVTASAA